MSQGIFHVKTAIPPPLRRGVDALDAALKSVEGVVKGTPCVKEVSRGPSKSGKDGEKLFSFALRTECM